MDGIRECKAFILVLSPDSMESRYVREEVNKALELGKTIFPVIYRPAKWTGEFESLVHEVQTLDLRSGSYTDNFQKLVDGLIEAGAGKATGERPFIRPISKDSLECRVQQDSRMGICMGTWLVGLLADRPRFSGYPCRQPERHDKAMILSASSYFSSAAVSEALLEV